MKPYYNLKGTVKFISISNNNQAIKQVLRSGPDSLIKIICNAALNVHHGDLGLDSKQKKIFAKYKKLFEILESKNISIIAKRQKILQLRNPLIISKILYLVLECFPTSCLNLNGKFSKNEIN